VPELDLRLALRVVLGDRHFAQVPLELHVVGIRRFVFTRRGAAGAGGAVDAVSDAATDGVGAGAASGLLQALKASAASANAAPGSAPRRRSAKNMAPGLASLSQGDSPRPDASRRE
jgi:hypothetical protein